MPQLPPNKGAFLAFWSTDSYSSLSDAISSGALYSVNVTALDSGNSVLGDGMLADALAVASKALECLGVEPTNMQVVLYVDGSIVDTGLLH